MDIITISEGIRMFRRSLHVRKKGFKRYSGNDEEICKKVIEDCWNKKNGYFQASAGHFCLFYSRDFSWCVKPLISLGHKDRVIKTLEYALDIFSKYKKVRVAINPKGKPFDFPYLAIDSLPSMIKSLRISEAFGLVKKHKNFLEKDALKLFDRVIDTKTGLVRKDRYFSSIKDYEKRKSSCYDNTMIAMLSQDLDFFNLRNPFSRYEYKEIIKKNFWTGSYFLNDLSGDRYITGDSNVFPYWSGIFSDRSMMQRSIKAIASKKLDKPFPLKYNQFGEEHKMVFLEFFVKDYENDNIWPHIGLLFVEVMSEISKSDAKNYLLHYKKNIEKYGTFLEVYDSFGEIYHSPFYFSDEAMLWSVIYLYLKKKIGI